MSTGNLDGLLNAHDPGTGRPHDEYAKGVQECRGAFYMRPQGGDKLRPYESILTVESSKTVFLVIPAKEAVPKC